MDGSEMFNFLLLLFWVMDIMLPERKGLGVALQS